MVYRVTFVCTGNICRSPMAEHVFRAHAERAGLDVEVDSSGTGGWHVGGPADSRTVATLRRHGYTSEHSAQKFYHRWFDEYDLIVALDRGHVAELRRLAPNEQAREKIRLLREFDPNTVHDLDVPDPYIGGQSGFENVLFMIEEAVPGMLDHVRAELKRR